MRTIENILHDMEHHNQCLEKLQSELSDTINALEITRRSTEPEAPKDDGWVELPRLCPPNERLSPAPVGQLEYVLTEASAYRWEAPQWSYLSQHNGVLWRVSDTTFERERYLMDALTIGARVWIKKKDRV